MMREGVLLAEESPDMLMARCNTITLEDAFLSLSRKQETTSDTQVHLVLRVWKKNKNMNETEQTNKHIRLSFLGQKHV